MQMMGAPSNWYRVSVSSTITTSSYNSDDTDVSGDLYIWGQFLCGNSDIGSHISAIVDILLPKPLQSNVVLDIHRVACGVKHAAILNKQGELFTWGEESGGRLGHGIEAHAVQPRLVDSLSSYKIEFVACGEFHTCAVSSNGELYTWGDGTHKAGLLGHGSDTSHWIPKRVSGILEGIKVAYVTCGAWHTALITTSGQLFTFGDGTFGVLGHGNKENVFYPREIETLRGLKTLSVSCGVWHTAAIVEVIKSQSCTSSGKLFTWGDGDKYRLGHGDREARLQPTCVSSLIDYNFHKLACGHSMTIGLTTSGRIFTMGSTVYGQLGNCSSDGKLPCLVEDNLGSEIVKDVTCGSYHVAILTGKGEVYTWGKGANGRLGHGDVEDRKVPTLVEFFKDRPVKQVACGSNVSTAIYQRKRASGAEPSQCSACRQAFGFTRKKRNCYNCGLAHCNSCCTKKVLGAALSPNPRRLYRICDSCYQKLNTCLDSGRLNERMNSTPRLSGDGKDKSDKGLESRLLKQMINTAPKLPMSAIQSSNYSRTVSPFSRKTSPKRSATPIPTMSGLAFSKNATDSLRNANDLLSQELHQLRSQLDILTRRCELQKLEMHKSAKKAEEAMLLAAEESAKSKAAKEVIKSLTAQLKEVAERLPPGIHEVDTIRSKDLPNGIDSLTATSKNGINNEQHLQKRTSGSNFSTRENHEVDLMCVDSQRFSDMNGETAAATSKPKNIDSKDAGNFINKAESEWIEQYEPGVYITLMALHDGTRELKRVRFSRRRFGEQQAETWWTENRDKVYEKYNVRGSDRISSS